MASRKKSDKTVKKTAKTSKAESKSPAVSSKKIEEKPFYKKQYFLVSALIIIAGLAYLSKNVFVAAVVDNKPVWRLSVVRNLEKTQGKITLDSLITEKIVKAEAQKQNVTIADEELQSKIKEIEDTLSAQGQDLDVLLTQEGITRDELGEQIQLQLMIEKLLQMQINITDEDINNYIETYKDSFLSDVAEEDLKETARTQLVQDKMSQLYSTWIEDLKAKSNIRYWVDY